jgi:hypothetical protein
LTYWSNCCVTARRRASISGDRLAGRRHRARHVGGEVLARVVIDRVGALQAFDQHLHGAVGQLQHLQDAGDAADLEHVVGLGLVLAGGLLGHQHDLAAGFHRGFQRLDGLGPPDEQRDDHVREHDHVAQRQQRQVMGSGRKNGVTGHGNLSFPAHVGPSGKCKWGSRHAGAARCPSGRGQALALACSR